MQRHIASAWLWSGVGAAVLLALPVVAAPASGNLIDLTVRVQEQMAGMATIPPRTLNKKICVQAGAFDPEAFVRAQSKSDCKITHYKKDGQTVTFDEVCTVPAAVTSQGVFHLTGDAGFTGTMHTAFSAGGHAVTVDSAYTGKPAGTCTYTPATPAR